MVLYVPGMPCGLCGRPVTASQEKVVYPPFVENEADPLRVFSDEVVHAECPKRHPLAPAAERRYREMQERSARPYRCRLCGEIIADPDDYVTLGHLTDEAEHALRIYNYAKFHRSCLREWPELPRVHGFVQQQVESGAWKGRGPQWLLRTLADIMQSRHGQ